MRTLTLTLALALLAALSAGCAEKKPVTYVYEGVTYTFADEAARAKFQADREKSLYHRLGGKAAIDAAVDKFYVKVLADKRINHFFEEVNMKAQHRKQKEFLSAAFGGPIPWKGKDPCAPPMTASPSRKSTSTPSPRTSRRPSRR
jgi:YHS domain-containing protein